MTVKRGHLQERDVTYSAGVGPEKLAKTIPQGRYCFDNFSQEPINTKAGALAAPGGTALQVCLIHTGKNVFQWATVADETDQFYPTLGTDGGYNFQIATTPVITDGVEINFGGDIAAHPRNFVGTSEDFFARVLINVTDASGADITFGLKKVAATVASLTEITDLLAVRILGDSSSTTGAFTVLTNLNNSGSTDYTETTVTSVTNLEDTTAIELEVRGVGGKGYLLVNGVQIVEQPVYSFDTDDALSPILRFVQTTDTSAAVKVFAFECGLMADRSPETLLKLASATA